MELVKFLTPAEELIRDLTTRLSEMEATANQDIIRERERSEQWCNDRWRRMQDETRDIRAKRDAMVKTWTDTQTVGPIPLPNEARKITKPIAVQAGSYRQFQEWAREHDMSKGDAVYISEPQDVRGMEFSRLEQIGDCYTKPGAYDLASLAATRIR